MNLITRSMIIFTMIFMLGGCAAHQKHESTGEYLDDSVITTKVKSAILADPALKVLDITVNTYEGKVQLSGFVDSERHAKRANEVASSVSGVKEVQNNLSIK